MYRHFQRSRESRAAFHALFPEKKSQKVKIKLNGARFFAVTGVFYEFFIISIKRTRMNTSCINGTLSFDSS
jgi:hypothetical protein